MRFVGCNVHLSVYGPIRDTVYWGKCLDVVDSLPSNIDFVYHGEVRPHEVCQVFSASHLFVFPTLGENHGHVISESLSSSTPVLLSGSTPWTSSSEGGLTVISNLDHRCWAKAIDNFYSQSRASFLRSKQDAFNAWEASVDFEDIACQYDTMFSSCLTVS